MFSEPRRLALLVAVGAAAALAAALVFQHIFGYAPCALCLWQRWPYYIGIPLAALAAVLAPRPSARLALGLVALLFLANAGLGAWHAGIEWKFWPGPSACSPGAGVATGDLMDALARTRIVPCDAAPWRFIGLSFAGWNVVISLALAVLAGAGLRRA